MKNLRVVNNNTAVETEVKNQNATDKLYDLAVANIQTVGNKSYVNIDVHILILRRQKRHSNYG